MSLSYSGVVGYGKFNLPSVESWGTNNNILKDPPKSITTRRRDKVGTNSMITQEVEMSRDRIAEAILAYPRGVNPMVGVSYNGQGNAGIHSGQALLTRGQQAKLPYRVAMDGAFRPPVLAPVDLLPLSRFPRLITSVNCSINNPDFRKKLSCVAEKNTYKPNLLNTSCSAKKTMNIKRPTQVIDRRHENISKQLSGSLRTNVSQKVQRSVPMIDRKFTNIAKKLVGEQVTNPSQSIQKPIEVVDRRQRNVRKNVVAQDIQTNQSDIARGIRDINSQHLHMKKILNAQALNLNKLQRKGTGNQADRDVSKYISNPVQYSMSVPKTSHKTQTNMANAVGTDRAIGNSMNINVSATKIGHSKQAAAPQVVSSCRDSFTTRIEPVNVIQRNSVMERPVFKRAHGMGGILVPNFGVYNGK